tara:strand:- start:601 stop:798 length:198 start_codon:yes stop_codon:yes gene_type:complete
MITKKEYKKAKKIVKKYKQQLDLQCVSCKKQEVNDDYDEDTSVYLELEKYEVSFFDWLNGRCVKD